MSLGRKIMRHARGTRLWLLIVAVLFGAAVWFDESNIEAMEGGL